MSREATPVRKYDPQSDRLNGIQCRTTIVANKVLFRTHVGMAIFHDLLVKYFSISKLEVICSDPFFILIILK